MKALEYVIGQLKNNYKENTSHIIDEAKKLEKQDLIDFLNWMNKVAQDSPMMLETDNDDIVDMYLNGFGKHWILKKQKEFELLIDFQLHLKDRDLIEDFNHDFEDEVKIFLYNKQFKNNE